MTLRQDYFATFAPVRFTCKTWFPQKENVSGPMIG
jgi:hypothetical protein